MIGSVSGLIVQLGLPMIALTWWVVARLYRTGVLSDAQATKEVEQSLTEWRKSSDRRGRSLLQSKWLQFGGGFYGVAALWTLIVIEARQLAGLLSDDFVWSEVFDDGVVRMVIEVLVNQLQAFIAACVWFRHWAGDGSLVPVAFGVAYGSYVLGLLAARRWPQMRRV